MTDKKVDPRSRGERSLPDHKSLEATIRGFRSGHRSIHPGLIPGISTENKYTRYPTNIPVFVVALSVALGLGIWAAVSPETVNTVGLEMRGWVVTNFSWFFNALVIGITLFMLVVSFGPTGGIRLGEDDSRPEYSTFSWISMLFAAGVGIGLMFLAPLEPLRYFLNPSPATDVEGGTIEAVLPALAQVNLEQSFFVWGIYTFVGGAIAYSTYRRGRLPLISALFEPIFPNSSNRLIGKIIDIFAVLVTLFSTATAIGIGALQLRTGASIATGADLSADWLLILGIAVLTILFTASAVTGIRKGIRFLSNLNMGVVIVIGAFVLLTGPTFFLLDMFPASIYTLFQQMMSMFSLSPSQGPEQQQFLVYGTTLYWAWWISATPFVGLFIAKISKGRTLREFGIVATLAPSLISIAWFVVFGGSNIWMNLQGRDVTVEGAGESAMFDLLNNLPFSALTPIIVLIAGVIFLVTSGDSATNVMGSISQTGRAVPSTPVTVIWGLTTGFISTFLLLAGGEDALSGVQSIMVSFSIAFAFIIAGIMVTWALDLRNDPYMIRYVYTRSALAKGVRRGIEKHGDDFIFGVDETPTDQGAGADFASHDRRLTEWYTDSPQEIPESPRENRDRDGHLAGKPDHPSKN